MNELLPCPFCGSRDLVTLHAEGTWPTVTCYSCGAKGPCIELRTAGAHRLWNTRVLSKDENLSSDESASKTDAKPGDS